MTGSKCFIAANLPLVPVPGVPEIRLRTARPSSGLRRLAEGGTPYWAYPWGGGLALARHLLDRPQLVAGRRVLDLGTGSGLVGIAAALAGARDVRAADVDPVAATAVALNAAANGVALTMVLADLTRRGPPPVDLVLVGDLFYERDLARRVALFLEGCVAAGIEVLVGDPWRAPLPEDVLCLLATYQVCDLGDGTGRTTASGVFAFRPQADAATSSPAPAAP